MRIVFVASHANAHTRRWVAFFAERGHDVHVVTCGDDHGAGAPHGYTVHDIGAPAFGKVGYLLKIPRARRVIRGLQPEIVHAHHATSYGLLGERAGRHPFVVTCHGSDVLRSPQNRFLRRVVTRVLRAADLITVPGPHVKVAVERLVGAESRVAVFQYGVEADRLAGFAAESGAGSGDGETLRLVTARPLTALYHTDAVIRAVALLRGRGRRCTLDVAGRGPQRDALERLSHELGVGDHVTFRGQIPEDAVARMLAAADVYVSVAESDGVSIALLEAMALGPVPVVSDIEANRDWIVEGENGILVGIDPGAIADGVERAAGLERDTVRRRNVDLVRSRADRSTNLAACEALLTELASSVR